MSTEHARTAIATGTCLTFGLAVAVALGAVPQASSSDSAAPAAPHGVVQPALARLLLDPAHVVVHHHAAKHHHHRTLHAAHAHVVARSASPASTASAARAADSELVSSLTVQSTGTTAVAPTETANIKHAATKHKKHHKKKHHKPAPPKKAPRTKPSASAISNAISGLTGFVHSPFKPTTAQVADFGDQVCDAFDQNQTFAHVKSVILQKVKQLPFTTVTAGAADYVVKTAVSLYCPGYQSKVS